MCIEVTSCLVISDNSQIFITQPGCFCVADQCYFCYDSRDPRFSWRDGEINRESEKSVLAKLIVYSKNGSQMSTQRGQIEDEHFIGPQ